MRCGPSLLMALRCPACHTRGSSSNTRAYSDISRNSSGIRISRHLSPAPSGGGLEESFDRLAKHAKLECR
ncbi:unnamed protein product [Urochloa humidicola]